jgi:hypothetical protein
MVPLLSRAVGSINNGSNKSGDRLQLINKSIIAC